MIQLLGGGAEFDQKIDDLLDGPARNAGHRFGVDVLAEKRRVFRPAQWCRQVRVGRPTVVVHSGHKQLSTTKKIPRECQMNEKSHENRVISKLAETRYQT